MASNLTPYSELPYVRRARELHASRQKEVLPPRPRGYDPRVLSNSNHDGKYKCTDCHNILKEPLQSFCGHRYCRACLLYILGSPESPEPVKCQACIQEGSETEFSILKEEQTFPDNGIKREMGSLPAECVNKGCDWKGQFRNYESHEAACLHKSVQCDSCGGWYKPAVLETHKQRDCPAKPATCKHCGQEMTLGKLKFHEDGCDKQTVTCEGCKKKFLREELLDHCDPETSKCPKPYIPCLFGCSELIQPASGREHLTQALEHHIASLQLQIQQLQLDLKNAPAARTASVAAAAQATVTNRESADSKDAIIKRLESQIRSQDIKVTALEGDLRRLVTRVDEQSKTHVVSNASSLPPANQGAVGGASSPEAQRQVMLLDRRMVVYERVSAVFKREIEKVGKQTEDLLKITQENKDRVEAVFRQFQTLERSLTVNKTQIQELQQRLVSSEASSFDGTLVWKINNFSQRRQDAVSARITSFYSPCFYTSRTGYKACARIYLNGDGMGKGSHVSLFFVLMRGEYDALLHWPFQQKVTMVWIDQNRRDNIMDTFRPDPTSSSFKRPTADMNVASGCPLFMPLTTLENPGQGYVKDDIAFLKVIIDRTNLE